MLGESERMLSTLDRVSSSTPRALGESDHVLSESERVSSSTPRALGESERMLSESERVLSESERVDGSRAWAERNTECETENSKLKTQHFQLP